MMSPVFAMERSTDPGAGSKAPPAPSPGVSASRASAAATAVDRFSASGAGFSSSPRRRSSGEHFVCPSVRVDEARVLKRTRSIERVRSICSC
jgi:hypothetical protein